MADGALKQAGVPGVLTIPHDQMRLVGTPFPGMVEAVYGAPGISVNKGQWLFRLSVPQALELRRDREQVTAQQQLAQQNLRRDEQLFAEGVIAEARLQATRASATQAEAQLRERQDALSTSGLIPTANGLFEIRAPFAGLILSHEVQVGQRLEASTLLGKLGRITRMWVDMRVSPEMAAGIKSGQKLEVPTVRATGKVLAVGRAADASQTVFVRGEVDNKDNHLVPGQSVEVLLHGQGQGSGGLHLPGSAIVRHLGGAYVFVQGKPTDTSGSIPFYAIPVQVLGQSSDRVLVRPTEATAGAMTLNAETRVVVRGASGLKAIWSRVGRD